MKQTNKPDRERQTPTILTYEWNKKKKLIDTENKMLTAKGRVWEMGKMDEGGEKVQISRIK